MYLKPILKHEHKEFVCQKIAEYKPQPNIIKAVKEKFDITIWPVQISRIKKKRKEFITILRRRYISAMYEVPIMQKRIRAEEIDKLLKDAESLEDLKTKIDMKLKILAAAHSEAEGKTGVGGGNTYNTQINQFSEMDDITLKSKIKRLKTDIINRVKEQEDAVG